MEKRYDHRTHEPQVQALWEKKQVYSSHNNLGPLYSIDTPPPTISGSLHIGHIFSYTQTDIIARYKRMKGFSVFYPFGFDDNGLPTERFVEKKAKVRAHQLPRSEFIALCLEQTKEAEETFKKLWQRMGLSANWEHCYSTISDAVRRISQASFIDLYKKGLVYRKDEPALYCTACRTSVAQAELDDKEVHSFFNDIIFTDKDGNNLIIGTTRPELLPSCVALLFNPKDERYQHLRNTKVRVPLFDFEVPVLEDDKVLIDKGTGLVMCCTFGDTTDIEWYKQFNLPFKQSIGRDGKFMAHTGILAGLKINDARTTILKALQNAELLVAQKAISHSVSVHERCKKEIEYTVLTQWFVRIIEHKKTFLELADTLHWYPSFMKARYINWVENLGWDWCISRQRFYGIPFPVWHCADCNHVMLATSDQLPVDPQEQLFNNSCTACKSTHVIPDTDVMDTWNTSALTPYIVQELFTGKPVEFNDTESSIKKLLPMSMRPQAHDIIRTWAFYTITRAWMHDKELPWEDIVISGHVLSNQKEKLSKSKGNALLTPEKLLERYPADVIRYWTASGGLGQDVAFSENTLKIGQKLVTKLWNAFKFISIHLEEYTHTPKTPNNLGVANKWILHTATQYFDGYNNYFDKHEFSLALDQIEKFFWHDFCDNYIEIIKDMLFNPSEYDAELVSATKWTLYHVGLRILQLYAPFIPHITETLYQIVYTSQEKVPSLHQTKFEYAQHQHGFAQSSHTMTLLLSVIGHVRKLKSESNVSLKTELTQLLIVVDKTETIKLLSEHTKLLCGITHAQGITYQEGDLEKPLLKQSGDEWYAEVRV